MLRTALLLTVICFHVVTFSLYSGVPVAGDELEAYSGVSLSLQDDSVTTIDDILILVFTGRNTRDRLHALLDTWLRHVPPTSFMVYSDEDNTFFPNVVNVGGVQEDHFMSTKVPNGILDAWRRFPSKKWFYKVDDDTFVHVHNLVKALNQYNWTDVQYIGHRMEIDEFVDCNGGAGYVFSRRLMEEFMPLYERCMTVECGRPAEVCIFFFP
ncbi:N-acetylgalactosaminide beta-1,3-galactosyltransferase, variant 3 [Balamuthia mandrillaris]